MIYFIALAWGSMILSSMDLGECLFHFSMFATHCHSRNYIRLRTCPSGPAKSIQLQQQNQGTYLFQEEIKPCPRRKFPYSVIFWRYIFHRAPCAFLSLIAAGHWNRRIIQAEEKDGEKEAERLNIKVSLFLNTRSHLFCSPQRKKQEASGSRPRGRGYSSVDFWGKRKHTSLMISCGEAKRGLCYTTTTTTTTAQSAPSGTPWLHLLVCKQCLRVECAQLKSYSLIQVAFDQQDC